MASPVADLHVHTTASDGELTVPELSTAARRGGIEWIAVTDHDRVHPELPAPVVERDGVRIIRGIELRVDAGPVNVDLLGFAVERTDALIAEVDRIQRDRVARARKIIDRVESRLGVDLSIEPSEGIGRPHIARAIDASSAGYDYQGAFDHLIGTGCPCYVPRRIPSFDRGRELLSEACAVVALAHPFRYRRVDRALALLSELDAVERYYPYHWDVDVGRLERLLAERDLLAVGGSDAHDDRLGRAGPPRERFEQFRAALPEAES
ncbi:MAG: PHP domain-containing protein [Haloferacaceae archaeon]